MKKYLLSILLCIIFLFAKSQNNKNFEGNLKRSEFNIVTGMCIVGVGFSLQPFLIKEMTKPFYLYPEISVPVSLGLSLTFMGI